MLISCQIEVKDVPDYAGQYPYWIVLISEGKAWFQAAYKRLARAEEEVARFDNGIVISSLRANY